MNAHDSILDMLQGHSQFNPLRGDDLLAKIGLDPDTLNDLLDDLRGRGALNRAEITKGGETFTALWPTGIPPRQLSWMEQRDNGIGYSSQLAHNLQQAAEASRTAIKPRSTQTGQVSKTCPVFEAPQPQTQQVLETCRVFQAPAEQERPMPRIARPAQVQPSPKKNRGNLQKAILEIVRLSDEALPSEDVYARLEMESTHNSIKKTLEVLAARGLLATESRVLNHRWRMFYSWPKAGGIAAARVAAATDPEVEGTLEQLRRMGADGDVSPAPVLGTPTAYAANPAAKAVAVPAGQTGQVSETCPVSSAHIEIPQPIKPDGEHATFAFYDDGALEIYCGDEAVMLHERQVARLVEFLDRVAP